MILYWSRICASTLAGSLATVSILVLFPGSPRIAFAIAGAVGGLTGCWLGTLKISAKNDHRTAMISKFEYERLFWMHLRYLAIVVIFASVVGMMLGIWMHPLVGRNESVD